MADQCVSINLKYFSLRLFIATTLHTRAHTCIVQKLFTCLVKISCRTVKDNVTFIIHKLLFKVKTWANDRKEFVSQYIFQKHYCPSECIMFFIWEWSHFWQQNADHGLPNLSWEVGTEDEGWWERMKSWEVKVAEKEDFVKIYEDEKAVLQDLLLMRLTVCWLRGTKHSINTCPKRWHAHLSMHMRTCARTHMHNQQDDSVQLLPEAIILTKGFLPQTHTDGADWKGSLQWWNIN